MKITVITSSPDSYACHFLQSVDRSIHDLTIILNKPASRNNNRLLKKIFSVGIGGVVVGFYMRKFYRNSFGDVQQLSQSLGIPILTTEAFKVSDKLESEIRNFDLGISMGNGYIPSSFFSLFKNGVINIHHEVLPSFAGAQSVVWPIIKGVATTGFSIHFISNRIDKGDIVEVQSRPIIFLGDLPRTVQSNYQESIQRSIHALHRLLRIPINTWPRLKNDSPISYTTPTFWQWVVAWHKHNQLRKAQLDR